MEASTAGGSARREFERRKDARAARVQQRWGRASGLVLALTSEPQSTQAWATGAEGEELVAKRFEALVESGAIVLHDRRIPGTKANIDHIVITAAEVIVVDTKKYKGKIETGKNWLKVNGRDQTKLIDGLRKQVDLVAEHTDRPEVTGALCFVEGEFALIRSKQVQGFTVCGPRKLAKRLGERHEQATSAGLDIEAVAAIIDQRFVPA